MTTTDARDGAIAALARRLFVPGHRVGWEYVEPSPAAPSMAAEPTWFEPQPPDVRELQARSAAAKHRLRWAAPLGGVMVMLALGTTDGFLLLVVGLAVLAAALAPMILANTQIEQLHRSAAEHRAAKWADFQRLSSHWRASVSSHNVAEQHRLDTALRWFPLRIEAGERVDVFGGSDQSRSAMLATFGCSLLASGHRVLVLDLTEEALANPLSALASATGVPVTSVVLPQDLEFYNLLCGLESAEASELIAEVLHPRRHGDSHDDPRNDSRDLVADLLGAVLSRLERRVDLPRLVAGLRALHNTYDPSTEDTLTEREFSRLVEAGHDVVLGERARDELRSAISRLQLLTVSGSHPDTALEFLTAGGLTVLAIETVGNRRRKEILDRTVASLLLRALEGEQVTNGQVTVVLAGADRLGTVLLERIAREARGSGVGLIYLFDHLRDATLPLLGGAHSKALIMRLGNKDEAEAAAKHIGHQHRFVLGQVSRQKGTTSTLGGGTSTTRGTSSSISNGHQQGSSRQGLHGGSNSSETEQITEGVSRSFTTSESWSLADSYTDGQVDTRVYEFTVEPTTIQSLPPASFVLVDASDGQRAVVMGTCDPRITELDHVAGEPR
jgi:hypothetical protein